MVKAKKTEADMTATAVEIRQVEESIRVVKVVFVWLLMSHMHTPRVSCRRQAMILAGIG